MALNNRKTKDTKSGSRRGQIRFSFESAADAKAVEDRVAHKADWFIQRTGKVITISDGGVKSLDRACNALEVSAREVVGRGRPKAGEELRRVGAEPKQKRKMKPKASTKSNRRRHDLAQVVAGLNHEIVPKASAVRKAMKAKPAGQAARTQKLVVLTPAPSDAKKLAKALGSGAKPDGARVVIADSNTSAVRIAVKSNARKLEMPIKLESGFDTPSIEVKGKPVKTKAKARRPEAKKLKKPSERTKPVWRLECKSSNIARAAYNLGTNQLVIEFINGGRYRYDDVKLKEFVAFTTAESQGQWFIENIKDVKEYVKLKTKS